jgi:flagellar hook-basal body complex protein FliE
MTTPFAAAAGAYANVARLGNAAAADAARLGDAATGAAGEAAYGSFGAMLKETLGSVVESGQKSDAQTRAMVAGKANMVDVVTAVSETEVAVETLVAMRNKVIEAYQSIMSMPI